MVHIESTPISSHFFAKLTTYSGFVNGAGLTKARPILCMGFLSCAAAWRGASCAYTSTGVVEWCRNGAMLFLRINTPVVQPLQVALLVRHLRAFQVFTSAIYRRNKEGIQWNLLPSSSKPHRSAAAEAIRRLRKQST